MRTSSSAAPFGLAGRGLVAVQGTFRPASGCDAGELSARIGVAVLEVKTGEQWNYKGDERFPLTSTFKTLACAKLLQDAERQRLKLTDSVTVQQADLVTYSPVIEKQVGQPVTPEWGGDAHQ